MVVALATAAATAGGVRVTAETLDRVVASINNQAITSFDVEKEYRLERFLDAQWPPPPADAETLAKARERLTYQLLLTGQENPGSAEKTESEQAAAARLAEVARQFARPEDYQQALKALGLTEAEVEERVAQQELLLRLIDQRLRPAASPSDEAISDYYRSTFVPEFQKKNAGSASPPLSEVEDQIREVLVQKRMNELLDRWIEELKPATHVRVHSF